MKTELEEVAEKYANEWEEIHPTLDSEDMTPIAVSKIDFIEGAKWQQKQMYSKQQVLELMKQSFEAGFKKADTVEAGLEPKETEQEINWILLKQNNK